MDMLNQQVDSEAFGELFHHSKRIRPEVFSNEYPRYVEWEPSSVLPRRLLLAKYIKGLYSRPGHIGFKLMYSQLKQFPELLWLFRSNRIRVVHLVRNALDIVISQTIMIETGSAHQRKNEERLEPIHLTLDPTSVVERVKDIQRKRDRICELLRLFGLVWADFAYERLVAEPETVLRYLEMEGSVGESNLQKTVKSRSKVVENLVEISEALACAGVSEE